MRRYLEKNIVTEISKLILMGDLIEGGSCEVSVQGNQLVFKVTAPPNPEKGQGNTPTVKLHKKVLPSAAASRVEEVEDHGMLD